jgi:GNAT superfamily N-acetyltransferase
MAEASFMSLSAPVLAQGLRLRLSSVATPDSPLVAQFYAGFDRAFVLPNEKETFEGIKQCLSLNAGADGVRLALRWGRVREYVAVAEHRGSMVGGANFIVFAAEPKDNGTRRRRVLIHLNYVFVLPECRGTGYLREILDAVSSTAAMFAASKGGRLGRLGRRLGFHAWPRPLIFFEQNDPYRLSADEYAADTAQAGIDQFARIAVWAGLGARALDFDYVQPPLSADQEPDTNLVLAVLGWDRPSLPAALLKAHLERFFAISVLKGADPQSMPTANAQIEALDRAARAGEEIALLPLAKDRLIAAGAARAKGAGPEYASLRTFLRDARALA